jgi:hypothetical protein
MNIVKPTSEPLFPVVRWACNNAWAKVKVDVERGHCWQVGLVVWVGLAGPTCFKE